MDGKKVIEDILNFCQKAGEIALKNQKDIEIGFKADQSVVTKTDLAISALAKQHFANYVDQGHVFIDEENAPKLTRDYYNDVVSNSEYVWALDPLDGTQPYALGLPFWGISVGILKNGRPWIGALYLPLTKELLYYDGQNVTHVMEAFTEGEAQKSLEIDNINAKGKPFVFTGSSWLPARFDTSKVLTLDCHSYVPQILWTLTGRAKGFFTVARLWDMCAGWAIAGALGFKHFDILNSQPIEDLSTLSLDKDWNSKTPWFVCRPENYQELRSSILEYKVT